MMTAEIRFKEIGNQINNSIAGKLFGKPCFKLNGKAFVCLFQGEMVFKLTTEAAHSEALQLEGAKQFDPSGKGRPMKAWIQIPFKHESQWQTYANISAKSIAQ